MQAIKIGVIKATCDVKSSKVLIEIDNACYVPELKCNLLSVKALTCAGIVVEFMKSCAIL